MLLINIKLQAQSDSEAGDGNSYCAQMAENKIVVVYQGSATSIDVKLDNGTIVKPDGTLVLKDGSRVLLREGQCINRDGTIPKPSE